MDETLTAVVLLTWVGMMATVIWRVLHLLLRMVAFACIELRGRGHDRATGLRIVPGPLHVELDAALAHVRLFDLWRHPVCVLMAADALTLAVDLEAQRPAIAAAHAQRFPDASRTAASTTRRPSIAERRRRVL